jgi:hypothetical protein
VQRVCELRTKPLNEFSVEDLRIMIGQQLGLLRLTPIALRVLNENPWAAGDYYEGDLLAVVLSIKPEFWMVHTDLASELQGIVRDLDPLPSDHIGDKLRHRIDQFDQDATAIIEKRSRRGHRVCRFPAKPEVSQRSLLAH